MKKKKVLELDLDGPNWLLKPKKEKKDKKKK